MNLILKYCKFIANLAAGLLWPAVCPFCGKAYSGGVCPDCARIVSRLVIGEPRCMKCGKPLNVKEQEYCHDCSHTYHHYDRGVSLWLHKAPVSTSVYRFKYHNQRVYGAFYAQELVKRYGTLITKWKPDLIMPIPLHPKRKRKRGYNQAEILAREIGLRSRIRVDADSLVRRRYTNPQKKLDSRDRKKNIQKAFALKRTFMPEDTVLLIDDIYTTGSTLDAAARVLKSAGVGKVYFLTISIGQGY